MAQAEDEEFLPAKHAKARENENTLRTRRRGGAETEKNLIHRFHGFRRF